MSPTSMGNEPGAAPVGELPIWQPPEACSSVPFVAGEPDAAGTLGAPEAAGFSPAPSLLAPLPDVITG